MGIYLRLRQYITLVDTLARFQLKAEARRFALGYVWWFLEPMLYVGVFYLVFEQLLGTRPPDFLVFLAVGKLTFIWFRSVTQASNSLIQSKGVIARLIYLSTCFLYRLFMRDYTDKLRYLFLWVFLSFADYPPQIAWAWLLPLMVVQYLLITGCGLLAALLVCWRRDFQMLIQLGMVFLLFMSGVFWDVHSIQNTGLVKWVSICNPLLVLLSAYREVLMAGQAPYWGFLWVLESLVIFIAVAFTGGSITGWRNGR